jgi:hypothetical protein
MRFRRLCCIVRDGNGELRGIDENNIEYHMRHFETSHALHPQDLSYCSSLIPGLSAQCCNKPGTRVRFGVPNLPTNSSGMLPYATF